MQFWTDMEGSEIDGKYPLRRLVRAEGRSAWFVTEAAEGRPAVISVTESLTDDDALVARLDAAAKVHHKNVVAIETVGRSRWNGTLLVYAVMEPTEENLGDIVRERPLTRVEAEEVADSLVAGLTAVHAQGLAHGRVEAASVLAVGETIKLRSDCVQTPLDESATTEQVANDVRGLGATLFQVLTQRLPKAGEDAEVQRLPAPFAQIVRNTLNGRWGLQDVGMALHPQAVKVTEPKAAAAATAAAVEEVTALPASIADPETGRGAVVTAGLDEAAGGWRPPQRKSRSEDEDTGWAWEPTRLGVLGGAALVVLLVIGWFVFHTPATGATASPAAPAGAPVAAHAVAPAAKAAKKKAGALAPSAAQQAASTRAAKGNGPWHVVAYTYNRQADAEHKVKEIAERHASLQPTVFAPSGHAPYLVALGSGMDRDAAFAMRARALKSGMPRDTFARNYRD